MVRSVVAATAAATAVAAGEEAAAWEVAAGSAWAVGWATPRREAAVAERVG